MKLNRLFLACTLLTVAPAGFGSILVTAKKYPTGDYPVGAVIQDFNNDGASDIASVASQNVSVFLNRGDGTFAPANIFAVSEETLDIASADLNRDGDADLVVTDGEESAYVVLGNGDGTFGRASRIDLDTGAETDPGGIAIADLNSDGIPDLAIAIFGHENQNQGRVAILIGVGDGTFAAPASYPLTHQGVRLVAADLNNDGKLDLAVTLNHFPGPKNALAVLLGNGDGTFQPPVLSVPGAARDIAADDFNGDGNMDLVLASYDDTLVLLGNGDGTFQRAIAYTTEEFTVDAVSAGDLNGDGALDLLLGGSRQRDGYLPSNGLEVLFGNGAGRFGAPALYRSGINFARIGYFNDDAKPDIVARAAHLTDAIAVTLGGAQGHFMAPVSYFVEALVGFDVADFDNDGKADVVASGLGLSFLRGLGDATLAQPVPFGDELSAKWVIATDFNGDHNSDLLLMPGNTTSVFTILGNGDGTFQPAQLTAAPYKSLWPTVDDFNHDGYADLALAAEGADRLVILLGKGDGTFQLPIEYETDDSPRSPVAEDFNGDGNLDLAISNYLGGTVATYPGHGDGTFDEPIKTTTSNPSASVAGDLNRDGRVDLVISGPSSIQLLLGNGDGTLQPPQTITSDSGPVKVADLDRDGRPDVAVSVSGSGVLLLFRGNGDGTFRPVVTVPTGDLSAYSSVFKDLNGDKTPEAIVDTGGTLTVLLNTSQPR